MRKGRGLEHGDRQVPECRFVSLLLLLILLLLILLFFPIWQKQTQSMQGEFWMTYTDFIRTFTHLEVKHFCPFTWLKPKQYLSSPIVFTLDSNLHAGGPSGRWDSTGRAEHAGQVKVAIFTLNVVVVNGDVAVWQGLRSTIHFYFTASSKFWRLVGCLESR